VCCSAEVGFIFQSHLEIFLLSILLVAAFLNNHDLKIIVIEKLLGIVHFTANAHMNKLILQTHIECIYFCKWIAVGLSIAFVAGFSLESNVELKNIIKE